MADLRALPSVDRLLGECGALVDAHGRAAVTDALRAALAGIRRDPPQPLPDASAILRAVGNVLAEQARSALRPVLNLTGTVLHTNLGRALLPDAAVAAATAAMLAPAALEFDLETGGRGERDSHLRGLLCELTGAEDATVVNNNAAAVLIVLNTLARGREAVVSRGELIEIGGAFRMPDIMARAGVRLVEVGTTNRTHARDYEDALSPEIGLILKVHPSNYRIEGFTKAVAGAELAGIARAAGVPMLNDLGSGTLVDLSRLGLAKEPTVREAVAEGADIVTFSGDKLLGGPQAGFIVGRRDLIAAINRNPMKRSLRLDKIRLAALAATLKLYRDPDRLIERLPTLRFLARPLAEIEALAQRLFPVLSGLLPPGFTAEPCSCRSQIGSGALPAETIPSAGLRLAAPDGVGLDRLAAALRDLPRPVIGYLRDGALVLDLRTLEDEPGFLASLAAMPTDALA